MNKHRRRKCLHCRELFRPDPRNLRHQRYCRKPECRKASKAASQGRWLAKAQNRDYFRGAENTRRVQEWTNGAVMLDDESFYKTIRGLEEQGLVDSHMSEPMGQRGGQPRRYYKLTADGQRAALEILTASLTGQL